MQSQKLERLVYLTAGAGGMFCGSCMNDNTLARALIKRGYHVQLVPVYTPIRTDEDDVTVDQVFFGGINIYLQQKIPLFRHIPALLDRFLDNPWLIRRLTGKAIATDPSVLGALAVSMLRGINGNQKKEVLRLNQWLEKSGHPNMILLSNMLIGGSLPLWKRELKVPIVATLQGDHVFLDYLAEPYREQATAAIRHLSHYVDGFLTHTEFYAAQMADRFGLERSKVFVTPLGIDTANFVAMEFPRPEPDPPTIGYMARLSPEKGFHLLVDAFIRLCSEDPTRKIRLLVAGWLSAEHRSYAEAQFTKLRSHKLEDRFEYRGVVDREHKLKLLRECTLFSVPCEYMEPKGLYVLEAMAAGVPVVLPSHGAFPEIIGAAQAGWLCPPADSRALAETLRRALDDHPGRMAAAERGRRFVLENRSAERAAEQTARVLEQVYRASR